MRIQLSIRDIFWVALVILLASGWRLDHQQMEKQCAFANHKYLAMTAAIGQPNEPAVQRALDWLVAHGDR